MVLMNNLEVKVPKPKKKYKLILSVAIVLLSIVNLIGLYFGNMYYQNICKISINRANTDIGYYKNSFNFKRFETLESYDISIESSFGYKLAGTYIFNPKPTNNTVIIVHGITASRWESMKYADMYLDMGFNVVVYDSRYHGKSGGNDISLGFFEKTDLDNIVKWVRWVNPNAILGVHGESLGAVTALLQANLDQTKKNVSFYVVDCPYSDISELLSMKLAGDEKPHLGLASGFILFYANMIALNKSGFSLYAVSPIKAIKNIKTPIMFIHGSNDTFIPASMSLELYLEKPGPKTIYISPDAEHAMSYFINKAEYTAKVKQFLIQNKIIS
ncbi:alpha/beta hydrolase [Clostridium aciditolerans]|uniref:Alpha/beta hydrolase n=2 Tax=Clostridium aciditolerans TaxID=339861 RepID=A0A934M3Y0_9CLOT|nr:alpha/beta hydrolase [Clostridium aciditolerans]MBI6872038.1 alpha/beta hydrolase [Clostridium aciditolerans]